VPYLENVTKLVAASGVELAGLPNLEVQQH